MGPWQCLRSSQQIIRTLLCNSRLSFRRQYSSDLSGDPVKYSQSPASGWKAAFTREGVNKPDESAWFQPYVVIASVTVFMLYFFILREENDIDVMLSKTLYDRIEGLEKVQLLACLDYNRDHNLPTVDIEKRLYELEQEEIKLFGKKKEPFRMN